MSAETEFRAALAAHAPLTALVGTRIAQNAVDAGLALPYVVFRAQHEPQPGLDGVLDLDVVTITAECWGATALEADAVADAAVAAIAAWELARPKLTAEVTSRAQGYEGELQLDATVLSISWIDQT